MFLLTSATQTMDGEEPGWNLSPLEYIHIKYVRIIFLLPLVKRDHGNPRKGKPRSYSKGARY